MLLAVLGLAGTVAAAAESSFWKQLTPEERQAAGLSELTPEQQAALDSYAARYARGGTRKADKKPENEMRAAAKAEVREEVRQEVRAEVQREMAAAEKARKDSKIGLQEERKDEIVRSRIVGEFNGWSGATVFRLENGQVWVQTNSSDSLWVPAMQNPEVEIRNAALGSWKLVLREGGFWLHVRRVK